MAYSELVKNFEKIRSYMRQFYVFGFKSRGDFSEKSSRSYDNEKRRIESWLGDLMHFTQTSSGKNVFISVDSRAVASNPFYKALKTKSFTDGDITLHFILFDILLTPEIRLTVAEILERTDGYLEKFKNPMTFDESTLRKKLKEYEKTGIIKAEKDGKRVLYSRTENTDILDLGNILDFFSEAAPLGVVGSYLSDKLPRHESSFLFKHHYITHAIDSGVMYALFEAMHGKKAVKAKNLGKRAERPVEIHIVPLKILISAQNGKQNLVAYNINSKNLSTYRLDYLSDIEATEDFLRYDEIREKFRAIEKYMWGVNCSFNTKNLEKVEFTVKVNENEDYIVSRLYRERRCGEVEKVDENHYKFSAFVFDSTEMLPWIRTFICRITRLNFSNRTVENKFKADIDEMYRIYGVE